MYDPDSESPSELDREEQVQVAVDEFLDQLLAGMKPDRQGFVSSHPEIAESLDRRLCLIELVHGAIRSGESDAPTDSGTSLDGALARGSAGNGSEESEGTEQLGFSLGRESREGGIKCPHCGVRVPCGPADSTSTTCEQCGSTFEVVSPDEGTFDRQQANSKRIGGFEVLGLLGRGTFGAVYKARDPRIDRIVAVKVPRTGQFATEEERIRFLREARNAGRLIHPGIVPVHEIGCVDEVPFIVTGYVEGPTLADWIESGLPSPREAAKLVAQVGDALEHAHQAEVVHRDVKPRNIILDSENRPHITDFGLARREGAEVTMTLDGQILGTPAYMSPEQAAGDVRAVDARSDVYSLGVVLYEMLTGDLPFRGNQRMLLDQVLKDEPKPPRKINDRIPPDLETICLKAMAKEPAQRYQTARAFAADLGRFLVSEPIEARPVTSAQRFWRWSKRRPMVAGLSSALVVSVLVGFAGVVTQWVRAERNASLARAEAGRATHAALTANTAHNEADALRRSAEQQRNETRGRLYYSQMKLAARFAEAPSGIARVREILSNWGPKGTGVDLRGWEWYYLNSLARTELFSLPGPKGGEASTELLAFSPNATRLAFVDVLNNRIQIYDVVTGRLVLTLTSPRYGIGTVAWNPDGSRIAAGAGTDTIEIWDSKTGQQLQQLQSLREHEYGISNVSWSPDGTRIASANDAEGIEFWDANSGAKLSTLTNPVETAASLAWSPDGRRLASGGYDRFVRMWDTRTGKELWSHKEHLDWIRSVAWSPDGKYLASASWDQTVRLWDPKTGENLRVLRGHMAYVSSVCWSPDSTHLASASDDHTIRIWDPATGDLLQTIRGHTRAVLSVVWSPDGRWLASASRDGSVKLWDTAVTQETPTLRGHESFVLAVCWSPDGRRIASASRDQTVRVWDPATRKEVLVLTGHEGTVQGVCWSPDGKKLASTGWDGTIRFWDTKSGRQLMIIKGHKKIVWSAVWSPDGKRLASAGFTDSTFKIWDTSTGKELLARRVGRTNLDSASWSSDGSKLAVAGNNYPYGQSPGKPRAARRNLLYVFDAETGKELMELRGHEDEVLSVQWSPDDKFLATGGTDHTVRVWNVETGEQVNVLHGHSNYVWSVSWSPDGKRIASASVDGTVNVSEPFDGEETISLTEHDRPLYSVSWSPDGKKIASAGTDNTIKIWDATVGFFEAETPRTWYGKDEASPPRKPLK